MPAMDTVTRKTLEYLRLRCHPKYQHTWNELYANKLGCLCQGIGKLSKGIKNQRVEGTETFQIIRYDNMPPNRRNKITYTKVVCEYMAQKEDSNRTRTTIGGNRICYPGDFGTPIGSLKIVKLVINNVLSRRNARFVCFNIINFYLATPMD